jgi:hypothetical protein
MSMSRRPFASTPTSEYLTSLALVSSPRTNGRTLKDPRLAQLAAANVTWAKMTYDLPYAGDADNPRPVPPTRLQDLRKQFTDSFAAARLRDAFPESTVTLAFRSDRAKMPLDQAIPVPREDLWWLAVPGDTVLLSDRRTHHYVSVERIDDEAQRIVFNDPWAERCFLRKGLNVAGVEAVIERMGDAGDGSGRPAVAMVNISRDEFLRVTLGIVTRDTPDVMERYFAHRPSARSSFDVRFSAGMLLLAAEQRAVMADAASHLRAAIALRDVTKDAIPPVELASHFYLALTNAKYYATSWGDPVATKPFEDEIARLLLRYSETEILAAAAAPAICGAAYYAAATRDFTSAQRILDLAITYHPTASEPRRLRAKVRAAVGNLAGVLEDTEAGLALSAAEIATVKAGRDARHPDERLGRSIDDSLIAGKETRRTEMEELRRAARAALSPSMGVAR